VGSAAADAVPAARPANAGIGVDRSRDDGCADHRAAIHYIQPGKPDQNAYIERFNRSYRTEVLNAHLFESLEELRALTDTWLRIYNTERPHDSLGRVPPLMFLPRPSSAGQSLFAVST
jgi:putative transposase